MRAFHILAFVLVQCRTLEEVEEEEEEEEEAECYFY